MSDNHHHPVEVLSVIFAVSFFVLFVWGVLDDRARQSVAASSQATQSGAPQ